jgi:hypothetical protein
MEDNKNLQPGTTIRSKKLSPSFPLFLFKFRRSKRFRDDEEDMDNDDLPLARCFLDDVDDLIALAVSRC